MGKDSPQQPDYTAAAQQTARSNMDMLNAQTSANRPNISTPWGKQTWTQAPNAFDQAGYDKATYDWAHSGLPAGTPGPDKKDFTTQGQWTSSIDLDPDAQKALDDQQQIQSGRSDAAKTLLGQATSAFQTPFSWGDLPDRAGNLQSRDMNGGSSEYRQRAQDAMDALQQPSLDRTRAAAETRLSNQGLSPDSEAYKADMQAVGDNENRAHLAAIAEGRNEDSMKFGQDLASNNQKFGQDLSAAGFNNSNRAQAIAEQAQRRGMSLNELNALLTGQQVSMPSFPGAPGSTAGKAAGTDYSGAADANYNASLNATNANNANSSSTWGAVGTAALTALSFY